MPDEMTQKLNQFIDGALEEGGDQVLQFAFKGEGHEISFLDAYNIMGQLAGQMAAHEYWKRHQQCQDTNPGDI